MCQRLHLAERGRYILRKRRDGVSSFFRAGAQNFFLNFEIQFVKIRTGPNETFCDLPKYMDTENF